MLARAMLTNLLTGRAMVARTIAGESATHLEHGERQLLEHPLLGRLDALARLGRPLKVPRLRLLHRTHCLLGRRHERVAELHLAVDARDAMRRRGLARDEVGQLVQQDLPDGRHPHHALELDDRKAEQPLPRRHREGAPPGRRRGRTTRGERGGGASVSKEGARVRNGLLGGGSAAARRAGRGCPSSPLTS